jgi:hypothetical protein
MSFSSLNVHFCALVISVANQATAKVIDVTRPPYSAMADGKTDTTRAVQTAITACPSGGTILFPSGTYKLSSSLSLNSNCTYQGAGADKTMLLGYTGTAANGFPLLYSNNGRNITVQGLTLNGGGWNMYGNTSDVKFTRNTVENILNSTNAWNPVTAGIWAVSGNLSNITVVNNTFYNMYLKGNYAFQYDVNRTAIYLSPYCNKVHVNSNRFDHVYEGVHMAYSPTNLHMTLDDDEFNNNTFTNNQRWPIEIQADYMTNTQVKNNHISNALNGLYGCISFAAGSKGAVVSGNVCDASTPWAADPHIFYGICIELHSGTADSNICRTNGLASNGSTYTQWAIAVAIGPYASPVISNNLFCGPPYPWAGASGPAGPTYANWEPLNSRDPRASDGHGTQQCPSPDWYRMKTQFINNVTATTCPPTSVKQREHLR